MIRLSPEQQAILSGASGPYLAKCMRWLVDWGEAMGATRLIPVDNTHVLLPVPNLVARGGHQHFQIAVRAHEGEAAHPIITIIGLCWLLLRFVIVLLHEVR